MSEQIVIGSDADKVVGADIAMILSSIAYCDDIPGAIAEYLPDWTAAWLPTQVIEGNLAFIAFNGVQYVVVIRGSILNFSWAAFDNWFREDLNIFEQVAWEYPADPRNKPMISKGSHEGLKNLNMLRNARGETMLDFLMANAIDKGKLLCVTGHSLGANLATVFAPWLLYQIKQVRKPVPALFSVLTFAAPTAGNQAFAEHFDASFTNSWRFYNVIDIVSHSANDIEGLAYLYPSPAPSARDIYAIFDNKRLTLAEACFGIAVLITASEIHYDSAYTHTNDKRGSEPLNTDKEIFSVSATDPLIAWFEQAGQQHSHVHYLKWLGAKPMTCRMTRLEIGD